RERLPVYPRFLRGAPGQWTDIRISSHISAVSGEDGLATDGKPVGLPWQEPDGGLDTVGRADLHSTIDTVGRTGDRRGDFDSVYGDWEELRRRWGWEAPDRGSEKTQLPTAPERLASDVKAGLALAESNPGALLDPSNADVALAL